MKYERNYDIYLDDDDQDQLDAPVALKTLINDYYAAKKTISNNPYGCVDEIISNNLKNNIEYYLEELMSLDETALSFDQKIWKDSFVFNLTLEYTNYNLETRFLGGNPSDMDKCFPLSYYNLWVVDNLNDALDVFERDVANNIVYCDKKPVLSENKMKRFSFKMNAYLQYLLTLQNNLTQGMLYNVIPCRIVARLTTRNLLVNLYPKELSYFAINQQLTHSVPSEFQTNYALKYIDLVNDEKYSQLAHQIQSQLNNFINFYLRDYVPYCLTSENSYGGDNDELFIFDAQQRMEVEQTYVYKDDQNHLHYIYGLGLTDHDLNAKGVGLSGMKSHQFSGQNYYQHYLDICSTTQYEPAKIFKIGYDLTLTTYHKMELIAQAVADLLKDDHGNWTPTISFDPDGIGPQLPSPVKCNILVNNQLNLSEFNKWLNQENSFFGREVDYWSQAKIDQTKADPSYSQYYQQLIAAGYEPWLNQTHVDNKTNAISGPQAFAGALSSMASANDFKHQVTDYLHSYFYPINQDYQILPYNIAVQEIWGAGQEGLNMFGYNINPYYSEHKWAFPSFIIHEAVPGHHTQLAYWTKYFKGTKDENNKPVPYFSSTGFHEGWAVFMEWFGAQANIYGLNIVDGAIKYEDNVPNLVFNLDNIQTVQNGFYYQLAKQAANTDVLNNPDQLLTTALKLAKLLTFYGYLNASQLRNIRLVVDTCLHADFDTKTKDIQALCSVQDVRHFINKYSAIGIGDQMNESKRYLAWPAQATSYMLGKSVFQQLFSSICDKYLKENGTPFFNYAQANNANTGPLFDLMLRNGEIPLNVLVKYIQAVYKL